MTRKSVKSGAAPCMTLTARLLTLPARNGILPHLLAENDVISFVCQRALAIVAVTAACVASAWRQERVRQQHDFDDPEGRLIGYYSAALLFSPLGTPERLRTWAFDAGLEIGYIPELSEEQRTAFQDKPEATNLAPVLVRPRVTLRLPGAVQTELSWVPPLRVFDVEANLFSAALSRPFEPGGVTVAHGCSRRGAPCAVRLRAMKT